MAHDPRDALTASIRRRRSRSTGGLRSGPATSDHDPGLRFEVESSVDAAAVDRASADRDVEPACAVRPTLTPSRPGDPAAWSAQAARCSFTRIGHVEIRSPPGRRRLEVVLDGRLRGQVCSSRSATRRTAPRRTPRAATDRRGEVARTSAAIRRARTLILDFNFAYPGRPARSTRSGPARSRRRRTASTWRSGRRAPRRACPGRGRQRRLGPRYGSGLDALVPHMRTVHRADERRALSPASIAHVPRVRANASPTVECDVRFFQGNDRPTNASSGPATSDSRPGWPRPRPAPCARARVRDDRHRAGRRS